MDIITQSASTSYSLPSTGTGRARPDSSGSDSFISWQRILFTQPSSPSILIGLVRNLNSIPSSIACSTSSLRAGIATFGRRMRGFLTNEALVVGVESRTSTPVRIPRDAQTLMHPEVAGLFPAGEGAGYAGGIISAALDGERIADAVVNYLKK
jgi:uncharacterized FAD-dependent dehydrogenase